MALLTDMDPQNGLGKRVEIRGCGEPDDRGSQSFIVCIEMAITIMREYNYTIHVHAI